MRCFFIIFTALLTVIASCGEPTFFEPVDYEDDQTFAVVASVPHHRQRGVQQTAWVIIRFTGSVDVETLDGKVFLKKILPDEKESVPITIETTPLGIMLRPHTNLAGRSRYQIIVEPGVGNREEKTTKRFEAEFYTGARRPLASQPLEVAAIDPDPEGYVYDASSIRVHFNETLDRQTLVYGRTFQLHRMDTGELVDGSLFAMGSQAVFDPDEDMEPGETYRLTLTTGLRDFGGQYMSKPFVATFKPISTSPRVKLSVIACPTNGPGGFCDETTSDEELPVSETTGRIINTISANSIVLGDFTLNLGAGLIAEVPDDLTKFESEIPLILRKGQLIHVNEIPGKLGGGIYGGVETGKVTIKILTDGVARIMPSSKLFNTAPGGPPAVIMSIDGAFSLAKQKAAGMMAQAILGISMSGLASVNKEEKSLVLNAVGFAEIETSMEYFPLLMDLQLRTPDVSLSEEPDTRGPGITVVSPLPSEIKVPAGREIIIFFDEPIRPGSAEGNIKLLDQSGNDVPAWLDITEPKIYLLPLDPLEPLTTYTIEVNDRVTDLAGNHMEIPFRSRFTTMAEEVSFEPGLIGSTYPGMVENSWMYADHLPEAYFSQLIDPDSLVYGETVFLWNIDRGVLVSASLEVQWKKVRVFPDEHLNVGESYRFVLTEGIENLWGVPIDTDFDRVPGGPDRIINFIAVMENGYVQTSLFPHPFADADGNGFVDKNEEPEPLNMMEINVPFSLIREPLYVSGGMTILTSPLYQDPVYGPRLPMWTTEGCIIFGTNTGIRKLDGSDDPGRLEMGRVVMEFGPNVIGDGIQGDGGLIDLIVEFPLNIFVENPFFDWLLVDDLELALPGVMRFTADGRMLILVSGTESFYMKIFGLPDIPLPANVNQHLLSAPSHRPW